MSAKAIDFKLSETGSRGYILFLYDKMFKTRCYLINDNLF